MPKPACDGSLVGNAQALLPEAERRNSRSCNPARQSESAGKLNLPDDPLISVQPQAK